MKSRSKNRRHQTAYEAPEVEGEFLNESADTMLSVSDSLGNLTSHTTNEIDPMLLEEFNEDQGARQATPVETPARATKRIGASKSSGAYRSARANLDEKKSQALKEDNTSSEDVLQTRVGAAAQALKDSVSTAKEKVSTAAVKVQTLVEPLAKDLAPRMQMLYQDAKVQGEKINQALKSKPYLLALGGVVAGFAFAKLISSASERRKSFS